jgi:hypothetical protein
LARSSCSCSCISRWNTAQHISPHTTQLHQSCSCRMTSTHRSSHHCSSRRCCILLQQWLVSSSSNHSSHSSSSRCWAAHALYLHIQGCTKWLPTLFHSSSSNSSNSSSNSSRSSASRLLCPAPSRPPAVCQRAGVQRCWARLLPVSPGWTSCCLWRQQRAAWTPACWRSTHHRAAASGLLPAALWAPGPGGWLGCCTCPSRKQQMRVMQQQQEQQLCVSMLPQGFHTRQRLQWWQQQPQQQRLCLPLTCAQQQMLHQHPWRLHMPSALQLGPSLAWQHPRCSSLQQRRCQPYRRCHSNSSSCSRPHRAQVRRQLVCWMRPAHSLLKPRLAPAALQQQ